MNLPSTYSFICAPITETHVAAFLASIQEAEQVADAIELRFDYLPVESLPQLIVELASHIARISKPLIFTFRPREQGGKRDLSLQDRRDFWRGLPPEIGAQSPTPTSSLTWSRATPANSRPCPGRRSSVHGTILRRPA